MENEQESTPLVSKSLLVWTALLILLGVAGTVAIDNRRVPVNPPPTLADLQREEAERLRAEEQRKRDEELEDKRRAQQVLDEQRMTQKAQAEVEAELHRTRILGQRKALLNDTARLIHDLAAFEESMSVLTTNDEGKRIAASPQLVAQFAALREKSRPTTAEVEIIAGAIPEEIYYQPPDSPLYVPTPSDKKKMEFLRSQLTGLSDHLLSHKLEQSELLKRASRHSAGKLLSEALIEWREEDDMRRARLAEQTSRQGDLIVSGSNYYGFYQFTDLRRRVKQVKSMFKLSILRRQANGFVANFKVGWRDSPAEGQITRNTVTLRVYASEKDRDNRRFDRAKLIFRGEVHGITLSGDFEQIAKSNPGRGHYYAQLVDGDKFMDVVNTPRDLLVPGAIWKGKYRDVSPKRSEVTPFEMHFDSRNRTAFTARLQAKDDTPVSGQFEGANITWRSDSGNGSLVEFNATRSGSRIKGTSSVIIDSVHHRSEFELEFSNVAPRFWSDSRH